MVVCRFFRKEQTKWAIFYNVDYACTCIRAATIFFNRGFLKEIGKNSVSSGDIAHAILECSHLRLQVEVLMTLLKQYKFEQFEQAAFKLLQAMRKVGIKGNMGLLGHSLGTMEKQQLCNTAQVPSREISLKLNWATFLDHLHSRYVLKIQTQDFKTDVKEGGVHMQMPIITGLICQ